MKTSGGGYTLVEVMIFVALTSFLLVIAVSNISSNQRNVQFSQGVRDFESIMADIINDVPTGYFPTNSSLSCDASAPGPPVIDDAGNSGLGTDNDCLFVGKALQFAPDSNNQQILVYPLAGRREFATRPAQTFDEVAPVAVAKPSDPAFDEEIDVINLQNGIEITRVFNGDAATPPPPTDQYGVVGILANLEGANPAAFAESQAVQIGGVQGTGLNETRVAAVGDLSPLQFANFRRADDGIVICLADDSGRKASLTIGSSGSSGTKLGLDTQYHVGCN